MFITRSAGLALATAGLAALGLAAAPAHAATAITINNPNFSDTNSDNADYTDFGGQGFGTQSFPSNDPSAVAPGVTFSGGYLNFNSPNDAIFQDTGTTLMVGNTYTFSADFLNRADYGGQGSVFLLAVPSSGATPTVLSSAGPDTAAAGYIQTLTTSFDDTNALLNGDTLRVEIGDGIGNQLNFTNLQASFTSDSSPAPEPSQVGMLALLGLGLGGLVLRAKKRQALAA